MDKIVIIDGNSLINRAFYAMPLLTNSEGLYLNAVYGFANMLTKIITETKPTHIAVCFDTGKPTFRHLSNKDYKATRKGMPQELAEQMPLLKELLSSMNIKFIDKEGFEADDLIGSLAKKFNCQKIVISGDKDLFQIIDDTTTVWHTKKGITEYLEMSVDSLLQNMEIAPYQVIELKSLMGDTSDNIKGVAGIGEKTALNLIKTYGNIDNLYNHIDEIKGKMQEKLINGKEDAYESHFLATIKTDVDIDCSLDDFKYEFPFSNKVYNLMRRFEFQSIIKRTTLFKSTEGEITVKKDTSVIKKIITEHNELCSLKQSIIKSKNMVIDVCNDIHIYTSATPDTEYIVKISENLLGKNGFIFEEIIQNLKDLFEDKLIAKIVYDSKDLKHILHNYNITLNGVIFDVSLCDYIIKSGMKIADNIDDFCSQNGIDKETLCYNLANIKEKFDNELDNLEMKSLYYNIELPLVNCLFEMETNGVKLDKEELITLKNNFSEKIGELTSQIYTLAGKNFNINSPKQLGTILFDEIGLPNRKKGSTANDLLIKLLGYHPIIEKIIEYRKVFKISGYVDAFLEKINPDDGKLHTIYQQKLTTTGRLSSIEPNLQNVPVRDDIGKKLRKIFVSSFEDGYLVSSDYSQIELKLLANFSKDKKLIDAYNHGIDIHTKTASEIFNIPKEAVTPEMRKKAKAINFGIIYGISDYGLSESINSSVKEAKEYIENYFKAFPGVKEYLDQLVKKKKKKGYAITMFNRRRKIPELSSSNFNLRLFGKRVSMNMPLQGSASDIIKIAMNTISDELKNKNMQSKLILQIHDELIIDCPKNELEQVKELLRNCMENVVKRSIPLTCDISYGKNWLEAL